MCAPSKIAEWASHSIFLLEIDTVKRIELIHQLKFRMMLTLWKAYDIHDLLYVKCSSEWNVMGMPQGTVANMKSFCFMEYCIIISNQSIFTYTFKINLTIAESLYWRKIFIRILINSLFTSLPCDHNTKNVKISQRNSMQNMQCWGQHFFSLSNLTFTSKSFTDIWPFIFINQH